LAVRQRQITPVALVLALTVGGFIVARVLAERDVRRGSEHRAEVAAAQIRGRVAQAASLTESLSRFMLNASGTGVTSDQFARNALRWLSPADFPAAAWVERVPGSRRAVYERRIGQPIVTPDERRRVRLGSRSSYLPATLVSGFHPMAVSGTDLSSEPGMAATLNRAARLDGVAATPVAPPSTGTSGLFLVAPAPNLIGQVLRRGYVVVFVSDLSLREAATGSPTFQVTTGDASDGAPNGTKIVRKAFTVAGQRFDVVLPQESIGGAAEVLPWIILAAGLVLAGLAAALGINAARREKAQDELDRIFTLSSDLITVANFDGRFTRVNPAAEQVLGYTKEELLARPYLDFVHPDDRERTAAETAAIGVGKTTLAFENRFVRKDGSHVVLEWTATPVVEEAVMYGVARDVTDRREAETEVERLADDQAALRRVATLVAEDVPSSELFGAVAREAGTLLGADFSGMARFEDGAVVILAAWAAAGEHPPVPGRWEMQAGDPATTIAETRQPLRWDDWTDVPGPLAAFIRDDIGVRSTVGYPIVVEGRLWGALAVHSKQDAPLPADTESRMAHFTDLVGTAIANAEARAQVERLAEEQAALRRVATLVAEGAAPTAVFDAVAAELERLLDADGVTLSRYEPEGEVTVVAHRGSGASRVPPGTRVRHDGENVTTMVRRSERPARMEHYAGTQGEIASLVRELGVRATVGAPIVVDGRLWGVAIANWEGEESPPDDTEDRMAQFAELLDTAIANADSRNQLTASRARLLTASDEVRRRFERDLHDGIQQRLVSLSLELRSVETTAPHENEELAGHLAHVGEGLLGAIDDLRELSRGIHPAILSEGGLAPALKALARRSTVPVRLDLAVDERLADSVEVGAYYVVSEALTNAAKHARASEVEVRAQSRDGVLELGIDDDGVGGADPSRGSGLTGLVDRIEALGGTIAIASRPGEGTSLRVELPLDAGLV
jgi:PAS domain S-box-containing protein